MEEQEFIAPIAGQSLTGEPQGYAWERPPAMNTLEDALEFYLPKLSDPDTLDDIHIALEERFPLDVMVESIYMGGVMEGMHSIDVGLLIAPVLHEFILASARANKITVREKATSENDRRKLKEKERMLRSIDIALSRGNKQDDLGTEYVMAAIEYAKQGKTPKEAAKEAPTIEEAPAPSKGLMSRRGNNDGI